MGFEQSPWWPLCKAAQSTLCLSEPTNSKVTKDGETGNRDVQLFHYPHAEFTTPSKKLLQERKESNGTSRRESFWERVGLTSALNCTFLFSLSQLAVKHNFNYVSTRKRRVSSLSFLFQLPFLIAFSFKPKTYGGSHSPAEKQFIVSVIGPPNRAP